MNMSIYTVYYTGCGKSYTVTPSLTRFVSEDYIYIRVSIARFPSNLATNIQKSASKQYVHFPTRNVSIKPTVRDDVVHIKIPLAVKFPCTE